MTPDLWLIGVGMGAPGHLTLEGRQALRDAGPLAEAGPRIVAARAAARARHGWIMDTYLLRRDPRGGG